MHNYDVEIGKHYRLHMSGDEFISVRVVRKTPTGFVVQPAAGKPIELESAERLRSATPKRHRR